MQNKQPSVVAEEKMIWTTYLQLYLVFCKRLYKLNVCYKNIYNSSTELHGNGKHNKSFLFTYNLANFTHAK